LQNIKEGLDGRPVAWYGEVFDLVFPGLDKERAKHVWKDQLKEEKKSKKDKDEEDDD
jgi:ATP-dependent Lon protease